MRICFPQGPGGTEKCVEIPDMIQQKWPWDQPDPPWQKHMPDEFFGPRPAPWRELAALATIEKVIPHIQHKSIRSIFERTLADGIEALETDFTDIRLEATNVKGKARL